MERKPDHIFDELLVLKCQEQDREALGLLWKRWQPKIMKWSFDLIKDQESAYEVAQESWLSIFKGLDRLRDPALFRFWAYRIVQRRSADWIRKEQHKRSGMEAIKSSLPLSDGTNDDQEKVDLMLRFIQDLPEDHQHILRLFYLERIPVKGIARLLKIPQGTVKSRLYYARKQLKKKLKEVYHE